MVTFPHDPRKLIKPILPDFVNKQIAEAFLVADEEYKRKLAENEEVYRKWREEEYARKEKELAERTEKEGKTLRTWLEETIASNYSDDAWDNVLAVYTDQGNLEKKYLDRKYLPDVTVWTNDYVYTMEHDDDYSWLVRALRYPPVNCVWGNKDA